MKFHDVARPYQIEAINKLLQHDHLALWIPVGFGKTAITLAALQVLHDHNQVKRVLIIAPKFVALETWPAEAARWDDINLTVMAAIGTAEHRWEVLDSDSDVVTINPENVPWAIENGLIKDFDALVIDEIGTWRSATSTRMKALYKAREWDRAWGLTGSPMPNDSLLELWSQLHLLFREESPLGKRFSTFRALTHSPPPPYSFGWAEIPGKRKEVQEAIAPYVFQIDRDRVEVGEPEKVEIVHSLTLPEKARDLYRELTKEFFADLGDEKLLVPNAAVLASKLAQVANGFLYVDLDGRDTPLHDVKLEALQELVEGARGASKVLVLYWFKRTGRLLETTLKVKPINAENIRAWNNDEIDFLCLHPRSAGHGINLQLGKKPVEIIWLEPTWSAEGEHQATSRVARSGYPFAMVNVHRFLMRDTLENRMVRTVNDRQTGEAAMLEAIQELRTTGELV